MDFRIDDFITDIVEASRPKIGNPLMDAHESEIEVYSLDDIKDWWCDNYRNGNKLRSCDAYYEDVNNHLVIEFKNTNHLNMKAYIDEIQEKIADSYMILSATVFHNKRMNRVKNYRMLLVYNDSLKSYPGAQKIASALNEMVPFKGENNRSVSGKEFYQTDEEYRAAILAVKQLFESDFFESVDFIDKKDFYEDYINAGYFKPLVCSQ